MAHAMGAQMRRAGSELLRVDELLAHAIEQLTAAFNGVNDELSRYQREPAQAGAAAPRADAAERLRRVAEQVARDVNGAACDDGAVLAAGAGADESCEPGATGVDARRGNRVVLSV